MHVRAHDLDERTDGDRLGITILANKSRHEVVLQRNIAVTLDEEHGTAGEGGVQLGDGHVEADLGA